MGHGKARIGWTGPCAPLRTADILGRAAALGFSSDSAVLPWSSCCPSLDHSSASNKERAAVGDF